MRDRTIYSLRIVLTVVGLVLFVVYSGRATSASTDRKVSGIRHFAVVMNNANLADLMSSHASPVAYLSSKADTRPVGVTAASKTEVARDESQSPKPPKSANTTPKNGNVVSVQAIQLKDGAHPPVKPVIAELPTPAANNHRPL